MDKAKVETHQYQLVNMDGCVMDTHYASSFNKARKYFKGKFEGEYRIIVEGLVVNVRL